MEGVVQIIVTETEIRLVPVAEAIVEQLNQELPHGVLVIEWKYYQSSDLVSAPIAVDGKISARPGRGTMSTSGQAGSTPSDGGGSATTAAQPPARSESTCRLMLRAGNSAKRE